MNKKKKYQYQLPESRKFRRPGAGAVTEEGHSSLFFTTLFLKNLAMVEYFSKLIIVQYKIGSGRDEQYWVTSHLPPVLQIRNLLDYLLKVIKFGLDPDPDP